MKIECPHCATDNDIELAGDISCKKCEKSFKDFEFSKRKLVPAITALFIGIVGGYKLDGIVRPERYPLATEYAIVDTCVNSATNIVTTGHYINKREICLCALSKTVKDISYSDYKSKQSTFATSFKKHAWGCQ